MTIRAEQEVTLTRVDDGSQGADGTTFTPSVSAAGDISWTNDGGKTNPPTQNIKGPEGDEGPAGKTAYESAVDGGYTGTEAEFNSDLSQVSDVTQYFWSDADGIHVTQVPQDDYIQDPTSAGINILINSTNGMQVLNGLTVLAFYSLSELIGDPDGAHVEITSEGVTITSYEGSIALNVSASGGSSTVRINKRVDERIESFPYPLTISGLADAVSGSSFDLWYWESGTHLRGTATFTEGTASSVQTNHCTIAYNGATGFTVTGSGTISIMNVEYDAPADVPLILMQGDANVEGSLSVNGNIINETVIENGVKSGNHGTWFYRKWSSGMIEAWYNMDTAISVNFNSSSSVAGTYRKDSAITIPTGIFPSKPNFGMVNVQQDSTTIHGEFHPVSATSGTVYWTRDATGTANITASIYVSLIPQSI